MTSRWAGSRVLVTGGAGFVGRFVCEELSKAGVADIIVPRRSEVDLTEQDAVRNFVAATRPDLVFHLAAEVGGIGANQFNPGRFFYANMAMGLHLVEAARVNGVTKFVQVGTVCAYPKDTPVPFREKELWSGYPEETNAPYGIAKRSLSVMLQAYREQYGLNGIYLLPSNLFGPGDNFDPTTSHVIPALIRKFCEAVDSGASEVELWGTGRASREFLFVEDAARGIVDAAERYDAPEPVNLGTGEETTIAELARLIAELTGFRGELVWDNSKPDGQPRRRLDVSAAKAHFGFEGRTPLVDGLRRTVGWWRSQKSQ